MASTLRLHMCVLAQAFMYMHKHYPTKVHVWLAMYAYILHVHKH